MLGEKSKKKKKRLEKENQDRVGAGSGEAGPVDAMRLEDTLSRQEERL